MAAPGVKKHTGPGKYFIKVDTTSDVVRAWLYNFDIDGADLKHDHEVLLETAVGPLLRDGGSIKLLGLASTTGQAAYDKELGERRMRSVVTFLRLRFGTKFTEGKEISFGKVMALAFAESTDAALRAAGTADNTEAEIWRAVVINAWNRSLPPPPPPGIDVPFNDSTWADDLGKNIDKVSIGLGIIDLIADLSELEAVTAFTGPAGLVVGSIGAILQLPLLFATADALANTNGQIQGAADAIQDMADQYSDNALDTRPLGKWPAVQVPTIHLIDSVQPTASQQAWRNGQRAGLQSAVQKVLDLETNPKPITLPSGKHIRLSGRLWLRAISKAFGDDAGVEIVVKKANEDLKKAGRPPFPTR